MEKPFASDPFKLKACSVYDIRMVGKTIHQAIKRFEHERRITGPSKHPDTIEIYEFVLVKAVDSKHQA